MQVTATEIKNNFGKYLSLSRDSDVNITKNGKVVAVLKSFDNEKLQQLEDLTGILDLPKRKRKSVRNTYKKERLKRVYGN